LLRVLQERKVTPLGSTEAWPVDIKLISATNKHLKTEVSRGSFRGDLYYRISGLNLEMPSLRERADKVALIEYIHKRLLKQSGEPCSPLPADILAKLDMHPWPGNVRQLISVLSIAIAMADGSPIEGWHLPDDFYDELDTGLAGDTNQHPSVLAPEALDYGQVNQSEQQQEVSKQNHIRARVLAFYNKYNGNISRTAKAAGVSRNTVYKYVRGQ
jgi:transcriptional regulator of acetoin/glycerol metabolism